MVTSHNAFIKVADVYGQIQMLFWMTKVRGITSRSYIHNHGEIGMIKKVSETDK